MTDVASLGIEVRSKGTSQATNELQKLTNAAKAAENAVAGLSSQQNASRAALAAAKGYQSQSAAALAAARASGTASQEDIKAAQAAYQKARAVTAAARADLDAVSASLAAARADQQQASAALRAAQAANQNVAGMTKTHNAANLAAQGFDVFTTAAGGMNAGLIGMQQGLQIAQVAMTSTGGFAKELGAAFLAMLSPVTLLAVGLTALAAVGIQQVEWTSLAASGLNAVADSLQMIAPYAVAAAAALALLYAPAIIGGTVQLIALLGRLSVAALGLAASFAAANPAIAFVAGITAAVAAANIFRDELTQIFGVDIVGVAKNGVNAVIGAFVGGYEGIKATWSKLPAALGDIVVATANAVITGIENMINNVSTSINGYIQSINGMLKSLPFGVGEGINIGSIGTVSLGRIGNPYAGAANEVEASIGSAMSNAMSRDYVGGFGEAIARGASAASSKLKELAKDITAVDEKSKKKGRGAGGKTEAERYSDIVDGANRRVASLKAEEAALGMTEEAALKLKYETELLNQAQQKGINLTAAQRAELSGLAGQMASTEIVTKKAKEAMDFAKDTTKGFLSDLGAGLRNGEGFWKSFGDAALGVLDKIIAKIEDQLVDALFSVGGSGSGGGGGFLGSIFGGLFGGGKGAFPSAPGVGLYASGTASARAGMAIVGEEGPELVRFKGGEQVVPNHQLRAANSNGNGSAAGQGQGVHVTVGVSVDESGNLQAYVKSVSREAVRQSEAKLPARIADLQKRRAV